MRRRSEGEPTGDVGMPARRIDRSFVSAGDEGEPGLTGRCSGAGAAVLKMEASDMSRAQYTDVGGVDLYCVRCSSAGCRRFLEARSRRDRTRKRRHEHLL